MKKLKLNIDDLKVESFETTKNFKNVQGTVKGYRPTWEGTCDCTGGTCYTVDDCTGVTCNPTCDEDTCTVAC